MKLEEIKVGMKVVPISKSGLYGTKDFVEYMSRKYDTVKFIRENGYGFVYGIENGHVIVNDGIDGGDYFLPQDLIPYVEPQTKIKKEKKMKDKLKFKKLKPGGKLTLRDDLKVGETYGLITYKMDMKRHSSILTVKGTSSNEGGIIYFAEDSKYYYSPQMFKEFMEESEKLKDVKVPIKVEIDPLFTKPIIEKTKNGEVYIFSGRTTTYIYPELGVWGISSCSPQDYKNGLYNKRTGMAIAYYNGYAERG